MSDHLERRDRVLDLVKAGSLNEAYKLLWPADSQAWCEMMGPIMEAEGSGYEPANPLLALWCYEQAKALYEAEVSGATSGGEGMALMTDGRGGHLGRKIWLLKTQNIE